MYISASKQIKFTPAADTNKKSSFVKKSALLTSGTDFRFNFAEPGNNNNNNEADLTQESVQQPVESTVTSSTVFGSSGGTQFKFNFAIDDGPDDINMAGLALK